MKLQAKSIVADQSITFSDVKRWYDSNLHPDVLNLADPHVYENVYCAGRWAGVFQFTAPGAQQFCVRVQPKNVIDIAAITSIYRPGPLVAGVDRDYVAAKSDPDSVVYEHPLIKEVLGSTFGFLVFQEQMLRLGNVVGKMPLAKCDRLRKVITKRSMSGKEKAATEAEKLGEEFIAGAIENGFTERKAEQLWDNMAAMKGYAFNASLHPLETIQVYDKTGVMKHTSKIVDVKQGDFIKSRDEKTKQDILVEVNAVHDHNVVELFEFELDNGKKVTCSMNHKFRTTDGRMLPIRQIVEEDIEIVSQAMSKVKSFHSVGKQRAYDLEVNHPDHQFYLANGLLTSNSHALSYAIDSYMCAWLLTYYEAEWLCAYMETQASQPEKRSKAISELKSFGYEIVKVDINHASDQWTIIDRDRDGNPVKQFMPSFLTVKGIGDAAVKEIEMYRKYKTVEDLLWNPDGTWRHSKFNKRSFESLIKLGAFESMDLVGSGKVFNSYRAMHACLIEDNHKLKHKKNGRAELMRRLEENRTLEEWSKEERIAFSKELVGAFDIELVIPKRVRDKLDELNVLSIDEFDPEHRPAIFWFIVEDAVIKSTKTNREYLLISATGLSGKRHKIYCWNFDSQKHSVRSNAVYVGELGKSSFGFNTQVNKLKSVGQRNS